MNLPALFSRAVAAATLAASSALLALGVAMPVRAGGGGGGSVDTDMPGEVLVKLRSSDALTPLLGKYPLTLVSRFGARPIYRLQVIGAARVADLVTALGADPEVMIAEANPTGRSPEARKNMPWAIGTPQAYLAQWAPQALHLAGAQALSTGAGIRVAVLDTGVDRSHPALAGRLLPGYDFVDGDADPSEGGAPANAGYGHGTHVAGLVALVAPGARILPLRVLDADGVGNAWVLAEALLYAADPDGNPDTDDGAQVINLSLGSLSRTRILDTIAQIVSCVPALPDDAIGDRSDPGYNDDVTRCSRAKGALVVAAAGNDASASLREYPAAEGAYGLLSVAATNSKHRLAGFSNSGTWIDLAAPGDGITSSFPGGGYATWGGTSMAAPLVAGTAALLRARDPSLTPKDLVQRLKRTASLLCATNLGQIDPLAALTNTVAASGNCN
jgi:subtilisin family serine protease